MAIFPNFSFNRPMPLAFSPNRLRRLGCLPGGKQF
jgi:hypothetical protein